MVAESFERLKTGYTAGGRRVALRIMSRLRDVPVTPNQLTVAGFALNLVAAVLIYERAWIAATAVFVVGSVTDALDGALARAREELTPFGSFLDSTLDRMSEAAIFTAVGLYLAAEGETLALGCTFVALGASLLVSYTRAKAEILGLKGDVGLMARLERIVIIAIALPFASLGALAWVMYVLAPLTVLTVVQRMHAVHRQLSEQ
jgi:CDP-diacylglycerol--glycerol-3-phosphate 3-phosphatidyltransferase